MPHLGFDLPAGYNRGVRDSRRRGPAFDIDPADSLPGAPYHAPSRRTAPRVRLDLADPNFDPQASARDLMRPDPQEERGKAKFYAERGIEPVTDSEGRVVPRGTRFLDDGRADLSSVGELDYRAERTPTLKQRKAEETARAKAERAALTELRQRKSQTGESASYHKRQLKAFDEGEGKDLELLEAEVADDEKLAKKRLGSVRALFDFERETGDVAPEAEAAQQRLATNRARLEGLRQARARIEQQAKASSAAADLARAEFHRVNDERLGITREGIARAAADIAHERGEAKPPRVRVPTEPPPDAYLQGDPMHERIRRVNAERAALGRSDFIDPRTMRGYNAQTVRPVVTSDPRYSSAGTPIPSIEDSVPGLAVAPEAIDRQAQETAKALRVPTDAARPLELGRLKASGVTHVGSQPIDRMIEQYGGDDAIDGMRLIESYRKAQQRISHINDMLAERAQMTDRAKKPLQDERAVLERVLAEKESQVKERGLWDAVREPTFGEQLRGAAVNVARGAAGALVDTGESVLRNAPRFALGGLPELAAKAVGGPEASEAMGRGVKEFSDVMREEAQAWSAGIPKNVREQVDEGFWTGSVPQGIGSTITFMAPGAMVARLGKIAGMADAGIRSLVTATVAATGAASNGNSFRREAEAHLRPKLESGEITREQFTLGLGGAELFGSLLGTTEALPVSRFARRVAEVPAGKTFLRGLMEAAGKAGGAGAARWMRGPGRRAMVDVLSEGFEEAGQEFAQSLGQDLYAAQTFDPDRNIGEHLSEEAAAGGVSGMLFSLVTQALGAPKITRRYKALANAVKRGAAGEGGTAAGGEGGGTTPPADGGKPAGPASSVKKAAAEPTVAEPDPASEGAEPPAKPKHFEITHGDAKKPQRIVLEAADITAAMDAARQRGIEPTSVRETDAPAEKPKSTYQRLKDVQKQRETLQPPADEQQPQGDQGVGRPASGPAPAAASSESTPPESGGRMVERPAAPTEPAPATPARPESPADVPPQRRPGEERPEGETPGGAAPTSAAAAEAAQTPSAAAGEQEDDADTAAVRSAFNAYDNTGESTIDDLVNEVEQAVGGAPEGHPIAELAAAVERYRAEQEDDRELGGRNDMDAAEDAFRGAVERWLGKAAQPAVEPQPKSMSPTAAKLEGEKINREWTAFSPESKSLGIPRAEMPQVKAEHRGALTNFLKARDMVSEDTEVLPSELKPTQAEFSPGKVQKAREFTGGDRAILVSQDNYVVDGHHQWMAKLNDAPNDYMRVIRIDAPIREVLEQMKEFPSVENAAGSTKVSPPASTDEVRPLNPSQPPAAGPAGITSKPEPTTRQTVAAVHTELSKRFKVTKRGQRALRAVLTRLHKANADAFERMKIEFRDGMPGRLKGSPAAYDPTNNVLYIDATAPENQDDDIVKTIVHEAGHFAEKFYLGEEFTQQQWERLTDEQRAESWREYSGETKDGAALKSDRVARSEWVAFQFARVIRGDYEGMGKAMVVKLRRLLEDMRAIVDEWFSEPGKHLTTPELDAKILEMLGYPGGARPAKTSTQGSLTAEQRPHKPQSGGSTPLPATKPTGISDDANKALDDAFDGLLAPSSFTQVGIPPEKIGAFVTAAQKLIESGITTPQAMARVLDEKFQGKVRRYSQALWDAFGMVKPELRGTHDWAKVYAPEQTSATEPEKPLHPAAQDAADKSYAQKVLAAAKEVHRAIESGRSLDWRDLFAIADKAFGGTQASGAYSVKDAYDAMELAMNRWVAANAPDVRVNRAAVAAGAVERLQAMLKNLPTQTKRTAEQDAMQQFSTPPPLAYVANWVADLRTSDVYLEPSAGTGGLAAFGRSAGVARIVANEFAKRRREILAASQIADEVMPHNAELLSAVTHAKFEREGRPTVVVMNPPFSNGAESGKRGDTTIGAKHVEEALKTLAPGGRLVAIVGEGMAFGKPTFTQWWNRIRATYNVRANIGISGAEYAKYGTTFDNQILVIDKTGPTTGQPLSGRVDKIGELPKLLEGIRNERHGASPRANQPAPAESGGAGGIAPVGSSGPRSAAPDAPARLGDRGTGGSERTGSEAPDPRPLVEQPGSAGEGAGGAGAEPDAGRVDGGQSARDGGADRERTRAVEPGELTIGRQDAQASRPTLADDESVFADYSPAKLKVSGAKPHPTPLVESAAMAAVPPPDPVYVPNLPKAVVSEGKLSEAQLEIAVYAGQAHEKFLADGSRRGFFVGDGTGVGKGREIVGVLMDNWRRGRRKAVWLSKTGTLSEDARRDLLALGMNPEVLVPVNKAAKAGTGSITLKEGVIFATYTSLAKDHEGVDAEGRVRKKNADRKSRLEQIVAWVGKDFEGVIAFDEAHIAGNAVAVRTNRGMKDPSNTGIAVVDLQRLLPKARILYVSATGATEVSNLSYADRLGIWGPKTPFSTKLRFFEQISAGGVSAMEIVARDLKALGAYLARTLSFKGVRFESLQQTLTPEQREIYDTIADAWSIVFQNMDAAMADSGAAKNPRARAAARSAFFGAQQRFFNQLLTAMEMPVVIADVKKTIEDGHSAVLQLVNTNEATQDREIARATTEERTDLEELDLSPKDILLQYVDKSFPTTLYQEVQDPNNPERTTWVPVLDPNGNPVPDPEALRRKDALLTRISTIAIPENPLEQVLNTFGADNVAEITGRSQRVVLKPDDGGNMVRKLEQNRTEARRKVESQEFQDGKRRILVFSGAGGTGFSYHASRKAKNQQLRVHFLVQAGWRADAALQGFGRTHRSDQAQPPLYKLVTTDIQGHKRFISTIARRLAQLGALTAGERKSTGQGLFSEKDNLESKYADDALTRFFHDLFAGRVDGLEFGELTKQMGFGYTKPNDHGEQVWQSSLIDPKTGGLNVEKLPTIQQFLNRLLALRVDRQNAVFNEFFSRLEKRIENAKADGTYDPGTQTYRAAQIHKVSDEVVYRHPDSTAETRLVEIDAVNPVHFTKFEEVGTIGSAPVERYVRNVKSGRVYALKEGPPHTNTETGQVVPTFRRIGTHTIDTTPRSEFEGEKYETLTDAQAQAAWDDEIAKADKTHAKREHFIVGSFLPIWDRIQIASPKIYRFTTSAGETMLGAHIPPKQVDAVKKRLGAKVEQKAPAKIIASIVEDGKTLTLANNWRLKRVRVSGENRIEVTGIDYRDIADFTDNIGGFTERIEFRTRFFLPASGAEASEAMKNLLEKSPIAEESDAAGPGPDALGAPRRVKGTAEQEKILNRVTGTLDKGPVDRARAWLEDFTDRMGTKLRQGILDQFASIHELERRRLGNVRLDASVSAWKWALLTQNLGSVMGQVLNHTGIAYRAGSVALKPDVKGLIKILAPIINSGRLRLWEGYVAAYRAQRLLTEGREKNFGRHIDPATGAETWSETEAKRQIAEMLKLGAEHPDFETARQEYAQFNEMLLDFAEAAGLIDPAKRATWANADYVPFYRIVEELDSPKGPKKKRGLSDQSAQIRRLKGGSASVAILENILRNLETMLDASFKNIAMQRIAELAQDNRDVIEPIPYQAVPFKASVEELKKLLEAEGFDVVNLSDDEVSQFINIWRMRAPKGDNVVSVMVNGRPKFFRVKDPLLLRSILSIGPRRYGAFMSLLSGSKSLFTQSITLDPAFMAANALRDSVHTWTVADVKLKPGIDAAAGFAKALAEDESLQSIMAGGGGSGTYHPVSPEQARRQVLRMARSRDRNFAATVLDTPGKLLRALVRVGRATENANRIAVFEAVKKAGGTNAEAVFQAMDLLNFTMRGDFALIRFLSDTVPFFNARLQGLYRMGRGMKYNPRRFATHGALITGATMALLAANWDDDRFWSLPEWDRDAYYHFWIGDEHFRIPKPFEAGAVFSTMPERMVQVLAKDGDMKLFASRMLAMIGETFAMNPIPQLLRPAAEQMANRIFFTGTPIVSLGDQHKSPEAQFSARTSETMRALAEAMPDSAPEWLRSPKRLEAAVRGWFGALGTYAMDASDLMVRNALDYPARHAPAPEEFPVLKRFWRSDDLARQKYYEQFYDLYQSVSDVQRRIKDLEAAGKVREAARLKVENRTELAMLPRLKDTAEELSELRKQQRETAASGVLSPEAKRSRFAAITSRENALTRRTVESDPHRRRLRPVFDLLP